MLASVLFASAMSVAVRGLASELDSRMIVLLRSGLTAAAILLPVMLVAAWRAKLTFSAPRLHLLRGLLIAFSTHLGFFTLANIPLATATVLFFTAPIFATILSIPVNGDTVGPRRWAAIGAGFVGAVIVLRPGFSGFHIGMLTAIGSSLLFATALSLSRGLVEKDGPLAAYTSSVVITVLTSLPLAAPVYAVPSSAGTWAIVAVLVIAGAVRGVADLQAYRWGEASVLAPIAYLRLVFVGAAGYLIFNERIDTPTTIGAAIIVGATLYIARREQQLRKHRMALPPGPSTT
jgi:drug/metabolite transporter (DMT)-like permease